MSTSAFPIKNIVLVRWEKISRFNTLVEVYAIKIVNFLVKHCSWMLIALMQSLRNPRNKVAFLKITEKLKITNQVRMNLFRYLELKVDRYCFVKPLDLIKIFAIFKFYSSLYLFLKLI